MKKRVLVVVAHPDDETIWMGGTLLRNKENWDTTILSLCRKTDPDRAPKFHKVCKFLGVKGHMSDLDDSEEGQTKEVMSQDIIQRVEKIAKGKYDLVFTHGKNGEYGHHRHIEVHQAIKEMLKEKRLNCKQIKFFDYIKQGKFCSPKSSADKVINLDGFEFATKKRVIKEIYGFKNGGFEEICCKKVEAFATHNIK